MNFMNSAVERVRAELSQAGSIEASSHPTIDPVLPGGKRPFWSVMIPVKDGGAYLGRTLTSILEQDPGSDEMEIVVMDDHSTEDDPAEVVEAVGKGRISLIRNQQSLGMSHSLTELIRRSRGQWIHLLGGDDLVFPGFYDAYREMIESHPDLALVFCRAIAIDEDGEWQQLMYSGLDRTSSGMATNTAADLMRRNTIVAPTVVVRRSIHEKVGGFHTKLEHACDWEMWVRIARVGSLAYIHHPYLGYRVHSGGATSTVAGRGEIAEEMVRAVEAGLTLFPTADRPALRKAAYRHCSSYLLGHRSQSHAAHNHRVGLRHARWALRLNPTITTVFSVVKSILRLVLGRLAKLS